MTLDPSPNPALEQWIDDTVRRQTVARLREVLHHAAEEIHDRVQQYSLAASAPAEIRDPAQADEVREPAAAAVSFDPMSLASTVAEALEHAAGTVEQTGTHSWPAPELLTVAPITDLPSTLPQLREQSLSATEAAAYLGVNSSRVRQRLLACTLYGFKDGASWRLPDFQFENGRTLPGVERIFPEIRQTASPVAVTRWFWLPWADLVIDEEKETVVREPVPGRRLGPGPGLPAARSSG